MDAMKDPVNKAVAAKPLQPGRAAFTLIELLVVIAIIAIIAALLLPAVGSAMVRAEKARAQTELSQIVAAIKAYYGDYGKMPVAFGSNGFADRTYGAKNKVDKQNVVMNILRAKDNVANPRSVTFLDVPKESMEGTDKSGSSYVEADGYFLDPWGNPYVISMDTDFSGSTSFTGLDSPSAPATSLGATSFIAAVVSYGPDPALMKSFMTSWGKIK